MGVFRQDPAIQLPKPGLVALQFVPAAPPISAQRVSSWNQDRGHYRTLQRSLVAQQFIPAAPPTVPTPVWQAWRDRGSFQLLIPDIAATIPAAVDAPIGCGRVQAQVTDLRLIWTQSPPMSAVQYVERFVPPSPVKRNPPGREHFWTAPLATEATWITYVATTPDYILPNEIAQPSRREDSAARIVSIGIAAQLSQSYLPPNPVRQFAQADTGLRWISKGDAELVAYGQVTPLGRGHWIVTPRSARRVRPSS
jgi:hypothetical protein